MNWKPGAVYHRITLERVCVERAELIVEDGFDFDELTSRDHEGYWVPTRCEVNVVRDDAMGPARVVHMPIQPTQLPGEIECVGCECVIPMGDPAYFVLGEPNCDRCYQIDKK